MYTSLYAAYFFFFKQQRFDQNDFFIASPDIHLARSIWNLLESKCLKPLFKAICPSIQFNKKIFIPMNDTILTLDNIYNLPKFDYEERKEEEEVREKTETFFNKKPNRKRCIMADYTTSQKESIK